MSKYRVFETDEFLKSIEKLDSKSKILIKKKLASYVYPQVKEEPFFGKNVKKLKEYAPETWRYRIGGFRIFHTLDQEEQIIYMLTIDHRKDVYR